MKTTSTLHSQHREKLAETITFQAASEQWLTRQKILVKDSTLATYNAILKVQLLPTLGSKEITQFSSDLLNKIVLEKISLGLSAKYVRDIMTILRAILNFAGESYGLFVPNKLSALPRLDYSPAKILSDSERKKLEQLTFHSPDYREQGIFLCLYTGLRIGELCALRWNDFTQRKDILHISRTLHRIADLSGGPTRTRVVMSTPKTRHSTRDIPIPDFLSVHLQSISEGLTEDAFFLTGTQHSVEPRVYQYYFAEYLRKNGLEPVNFHCLRHTFATRCIEEGFDPKALSEILGHSSVKITLDRYVHSSIDTKRKYMQLLNMN